MFEITMPQAIGVLPVQHEGIPDCAIMSGGQGTDGGPFPPAKFMTTEIQALGQTSDGPSPPPPTRFTFIIESVVSIGQDEGPRPPPKFTSDYMSSLGTTSDAPSPPQPAKYSFDSLQSIGQDGDGGPPPPTKWHGLDGSIFPASIVAATEQLTGTPEKFTSPRESIQLNIGTEGVADLGQGDGGGPLPPKK